MPAPSTARFLVACVALLSAPFTPAHTDTDRDTTPASFENSIGITMVRIPAGTFRMGNALPTDPRTLQHYRWRTHGDHDETPVHDVRLTRELFISATEITVAQFQQFRQEYQDASRFTPFVTGISYDEAVAFCAWLGAREGKPYRLPTEAEWEYVARAGSTGHFSSGATPPPDDQPNAFGVRNMHGAAIEWVADWYGPYPWEPQTDPVGPAAGWGRVVRGGGPQGARGDRDGGLLPFYRRSANRASAPPTYRGMHPIGFRVVQAEAPATPPSPAAPSFPLQFVKQRGLSARLIAEAAPRADRPWYRTRPLLPVPPENMMPDAIRAAGLDPALGGHNHSAGLAVAPNGDVLVVAFTAITQQAEYQPSNAFLVTRRRFGSEQWDPPALFMDLADVQDASALLWVDRETVHFFGGGVGLSGVPFRWSSSTDSGATWSPLRLPFFDPPLGGYSPQPISTAFRTDDGTIHVPIDGVGGQSLLLASRDEGRTWYDVARDPGARGSAHQRSTGPGSASQRSAAQGGTRGRHTVYAVLDDGSLFALGGKETNIDGFMPQFRSTDGGRTWAESRSPFPALASHQRPTLVRLKSGRLFFASDWQDRNGRQPAGVTTRGAFVALSSDRGRTWRIKTLPNARPHEAATFPERGRRDWADFIHDSATLGYAVATQGPNGMIHLITSMTHPSEEFEMNEAWILSDSQEQSATGSTTTGSVLRGEERYANGRLRASWTGVRTTDGRYLLDGVETWFTPTGAKVYEVTYRQGVKTGKETWWVADGAAIWEWERGAGDRAVWTQYWSNGQRKHRSEWRGVVCDGPAAAWTPDGAPAGEWRFVNGDLAPEAPASPPSPSPAKSPVMSARAPAPARASAPPASASATPAGAAAPAAATQPGTPEEPVRYEGGVRVTDAHDGGLRPAIGVKSYQVLRANRAHPALADRHGWTYNHAPMLAYWNGRFSLEYLSSPVSENVSPMQTLVTTSTDGQRWDTPTVVFPPYKLPNGKIALMHQRMGFYVAPNGRLLALGFYGLGRDIGFVDGIGPPRRAGQEPSPNDGTGIGRVVRDVRPDGTFGPIHFIRYNTHNGWHEGNTTYQLYSSSKDAGFVEACRALLADKLMTLQWWEEDRSTDGFYPPMGRQLKALSFFHRRDGAVVGLWKDALTALSKDEGRTWSAPVTASTLIMAGAKVWGQRTPDGRYALVYNPRADNRHRWPLAIVTGDDGVRFDEMRVLVGEVPPRRYNGLEKTFGPQYVRGIAEGNGTPPGNAFWLAYSMNKEDMWVSRVPVPVRETVDGPVHDTFEEGQTVDLEWNLYSPQWAPVTIATVPERKSANPGTIANSEKAANNGKAASPRTSMSAEKSASVATAGNRALELRDAEPADYARAERVFPEAERATVSFKVLPSQADRGRLEIEILSRDGNRPQVIVQFDERGRILAYDGARLEPVVLSAYTAGSWYAFAINVKAGRQRFDLSLNGKALLTDAEMLERWESVERLSFRTGAFRDTPTTRTPQSPGEDLPRTDARVPAAVYYVDDVEVQVARPAPPVKPPTL